MYKIISYVIPDTILPQFHCVAVLSFQKVSMGMSTNVTTTSNKSTNQADPQVFWALKLERNQFWKFFYNGVWFLQRLHVKCNKIYFRNNSTLTKMGHKMFNHDKIFQFCLGFYYKKCFWRDTALGRGVVILYISTIGRHLGRLGLRRFSALLLLS